MAKKILSVFLLLTFIFSLSVCASAAGYTDTQVRYSVIPFNYIQTSDLYYSAEYAGTVSHDGSAVTVTVPGLEQYVETVSGDGSFRIRNVVSCTDYFSGIRLHATNVVVHWPTFLMTIQAGIPDTSGGVYTAYNFGIEEIAHGSSVYYLNTHEFSGSVSGGEFDFRSLVQTLAGSASWFDSSGYVFFEYIDLVCTGIGVSATGDYSVTQASSTSIPSVELWFDQYNLPTVRGDVGTVDLVGWLTTSIGSFLSFKLIPGVSISSLIEFIVVIGLVFWFLTLLI
jgi:hypothetical protein